MEPIVNMVGFSIQQFETANVDDLKRYVIATMWDSMLSRLEENSPIRIVLNRERLNQYVAMICRAGKKSDFLQKLLEKTLGEEVVEAQGVTTQPITLQPVTLQPVPFNTTATAPAMPVGAVTPNRIRKRTAINMNNNKNANIPVPFGPPSQLGTQARTNSTNSTNSGRKSKRSKQSSKQSSKK
jgi:hypothetical protein